jgi:hypothetical protein
MWHFHWYMYVLLIFSVVCFIFAALGYIQPADNLRWEAREQAEYENIMTSGPPVAVGIVAIVAAVAIQHTLDSSRMTRADWSAAKSWQTSSHTTIFSLDARGHSFTYVATGTTVVCQGGIIKPAPNGPQFYRNPAC